MRSHERIKYNFMPQYPPPRTFIEYSISSPPSFDGNNNHEPIFVGLSPIMKKSRPNKKITVYDISSIHSSNEDEPTENDNDRFHIDDFFPQKDSMSPQEILNIFSQGIDCILYPQADTNNGNQIFASSTNLRSLRSLSKDLATRAMNSPSSSSLLPFNSTVQNTNIKLIYDSYFMIASKLRLYTVHDFLKNNISVIESVSEIGQMYKNCQTKVNSITSAFSPLCLSNLHLTLDFNEVFQQTIHDVFTGKKAINNSTASGNDSNDNKSDNSNRNNVFSFSDSNGFGFNDSNGFDATSNPFNSFGSGSNSNDFSNAFNIFQSNNNSNDNNCSGNCDGESAIVVDFDGESLFAKICDLVIRYFLANVIQKNMFSSSLKEINKENDDNLEAFYYNINNSSSNGCAKSNKNDFSDDLSLSIQKDVDFCNAFRFIKATGSLYESRFIPSLITVIINEYSPIVSELFEKCDVSEGSSTTKDLTLYFSDIQKIENELNQSLKSVSFLLSNHSIEQIKVDFRKLAFASKLDDICKSGLRMLVKKKDIQTIELCAEFAKSTNKIQTFAHELSFDFESIVADCFKHEMRNEGLQEGPNPIRESIDYLKMLNELCEISFNNSGMIRMLQDAFRKGINTLPDLAARLLADEVNMHFLNLPTFTSSLLHNQNNNSNTNGNNINNNFNANNNNTNTNANNINSNSNENSINTNSNANNNFNTNGNNVNSINTNSNANNNFNTNGNNASSINTNSNENSNFNSNNANNNVGVNNNSGVNGLNRAGKSDMFVHLSFISDLISVFKYLTCKDVFEVYYNLYLSRRVLMLKASVIQADEYFAKQLRDICGPDYTKRIDTIFDDLHSSSRILDDFHSAESKSKKLSPRYFKALVLSHSSWIQNVDDLHRTPIETPSEVTDILSTFAQFYLSRNPGKQLEWNHHFSRVKLAVQNLSSTVKEIQCNGIAATILCLFNHHDSLTKKEIIDLCKGNEKIIEECIKVLKSKKSGKLLVSSKSSLRKSYVVDFESTESAKVIKLPFIKMTIPRSETDNAIMHVGTSRAQVIDANVMLLLKRDHSMEKSELKEMIKETIMFRLDDELFEKELQNLAKKLYLRIDPSGRVHYLP